MQITTWEASKKYGFSTGYLRHLLIKKTIKGRQGKVADKKSIWLLDEDSLKKFLKKERKPGPRSKKKSS